MLPFHALEERAIASALDFANIWLQDSGGGRSLLTSPSEVHMIFQRLSSIGFKTIDELDPYRADQAELRSWLDSLTRWRTLKTAQRQRTHAEIAKRLGDTVRGVASWHLVDGELRAEVAPSLNGVQAAYSFAAALLADESANRWQGLRRCRLPSCRKFFWETQRRAGPPRQYCSDWHATADRKARFNRRSMARAKK